MGASFMGGIPEDQQDPRRNLQAALEAQAAQGMQGGTTPSQPQPQPVPAASPNLASSAPTIPPVRQLSINDVNVNSLPATPRLQRQEQQFDQTSFLPPQPTMKEALLNTIVRSVPLIAGLASRNLPYAAGAAQGTVEGGRYAREQQLEQQKIGVGQMNEQRGLQEKQLEAELRERTLQAQMEQMNAYRQGLLGERHLATEVRGGHYANMDAAKRTQLGIDDAGNPLDISHLPMQQQVKIELGRKQAELDDARIAVATDPNNIQNHLKMMNLEREMQMLGVSLAHLGIAEQGNERQQKAFERDTYGTVGGVPVPGAYTTDEGKTVGAKFSGNVKPTTPLRQAGAIQVAQKDLIDSIRAHADQLGPAWGRINHLRDLASFAPKDFAKIEGMATSWAALQPGLHGFRGMRAVDAFEKAMGGPQQNIETFIAKIEGIGNASKAMQTGSVPQTAGGKVIPGAKPSLQKKGNVAPDGTIVDVGGGKHQIKQSGKWVDYKGPIQ